MSRQVAKHVQNWNGGRLTVSSSGDGQALVSNPVFWDAIASPVPGVTSYNVKQHLNDPQGLVSLVEAIGLIGTASYDDGTGIITFGDVECPAVRMRATYTIGGGSSSNAQQFEDALSAAIAGGGNAVIQLEDGVYTFSSLTRAISAPNITIRSVSGNPLNCILEGDAMSASAEVRYIFQQIADNFILENVTLRKVGDHLIQMKGVDGLTLRNVIFEDCYTQFLKLSNEDPNYNDNLYVENCQFRFTAGIAPWYYTAGVDAHRTRNATVVGSVFEYFKSPAITQCEPAIHFWVDSENIITARNRVMHCDRGIGYGLSQGQGVDGGEIKNNVVYRGGSEAGSYADVGIGLFDSDNVLLDNNTVFFADGYPNAIEDRWASTGSTIRNNLTNKAIQERDGGDAFKSNNKTDVSAGDFTDIAAGNPTLSSENTAIVDQGAPLAHVLVDYFDAPRPSQPGGGHDIGAYEYPLVGTFTPLQLGSVLWAWLWAGDNASNLTLVDDAFGPKIAAAGDLSGNGNDFFNNDQQTGIPDRPNRMAYEAPVNYNSWSSELGAIMLEGYRLRPGTSFSNVYQQTIYQATSIDAGDFNLYAVIANTRDGGNRYLWGTTSTNNIRLEQSASNSRVNMTIAGSTFNITAAGAVPHNQGAIILQVKRENNVISCLVNGTDITSGSPVNGAAFGMSGIGGGAQAVGSGWDDWAHEFVACKGVLTPSQESQMVQYLTDKWNIN